MNDKTLKLKKTEDKTNSSQESEQHGYKNIGLFFTLYFFETFLLINKQ